LVAASKCTFAVLEESGRWAIDNLAGVQIVELISRTFVARADAISLSHPQRTLTLIAVQGVVDLATRTDGNRQTGGGALVGHVGALAGVESCAPDPSVGAGYLRWNA
jgi:hypothetical protein